MKKKLNKIISALLVLASLISMFAVFVYAEDDLDSSVTDTETDTDTENSGEGTDGDEEEDAEEAPSIDLSAIELIYNRNFEEGWDYNNGFSKFTANKTTVHNAHIDFEETATYKYNYFWRIEASDYYAATATSSLTVGALRESGSVIQFKIKADDACDLGRILYMTTPANKAVNLLYISGNTLYAFNSGTPATKIGELTNEWLSVTMVFDWDASKTLASGATETLFKCRVYYGDDGKYFDYEADYEVSKDKGMKTLSFCIDKATSADRAGMSFCIDDLQVYQKVKEPLDLSGVTDYGTKINPLAAIVVDIQDGPGNKSTEQIINEALCMKVGVNTALRKNKKVSIAEYCTPEIVDGHVMIPLSLFLDFINYPFYIHGESYDITTGTSATYITIGRDTANVDGERIELTVAPGYLTNDNGDQIPVMAAEDIPRIFPGWLLTYDDMGLIIIYAGEASEGGTSLIHRDTDLDVMLTIMKKFIFDTVTQDENGKEFDEIDDSYVATGEQVLSDLRKHSASHPYIFTNQENFDKLNAAYAATENNDVKLQGYLKTLVDAAEAIYTEYALLDDIGGAYAGIIAEKVPVNEYFDGKNPDPAVKGDTTVPDTNDGYSPAGTLESIEKYTALLVDLAFAYQVTREAKYADLAYDISIALGQWTHWGPGSVENCATATANFAIAYDWLYNYYSADANKDIAALAGILYEKGVKHGYNSSAGNSCLFPRSMGGGDVYNTSNTYLNALCSSGMIVGALALADYYEYDAATSYLIGNNIQNLIANGLDQYAPDGSYAESALMWADATNGFTKLIMALESATGTTYGFEDTWGLDKTFYFACYIEDSDGKIWNYHEGGADGVITGDILGIDTQMFNYAGKFLKDSTLIAIRKNQLEKGKAVTIFDMLFYPDDSVDSEKELALDYQMEGIHAFVSRSDWEDGALYTGIMGGSNDVYGGQLDSGNFIYRNEGVDWIIDLGSDNQEIYSYNGAYRNHHYRNNAEGQNVIIVTTAQDALPYGQLTTGNGKLINTYSNEFGSYAILENKSAYGSTVSFANRGLLVTNNRKTVVIQDELSFPKFQELTWIAHTASSIKLDPTGKIAYLTDYDETGREHILRATIVSGADYSFKIENCNDSAKILDATYKSSDYKTNGGVQPYSRDGIQRLVIKTKNVLTFNASVVFEIVESTESTEPVGYSFAYMSTWNPVEDSTGNNQTVVEREDPSKADIINEVIYLDLYANTLKTAYTSNINEFFYSLTKIAYTLKTYTPESLDSETLMNSYSSYEDYLNDYEKYIKRINTAVEATNNLTKSMSGMTSTGK